MKAVFYTCFALVAFAFNSILCRAALGGGLIDAASFTTVRLASGALALYLIYNLSGTNKADERKGSWSSAAFLFAYAVCFSFAYISLSTGVGALILFGAVQATMIVAAIATGESPGFFEWLGLLGALGGLVYLVFPGLAAPPFSASLLMAIGGVAWGFYTLRGRKSANALADTAGNFMRSVPMILPVSIWFLSQLNATVSGILLAAASGAIASGIGYAVWYAALRHHTSTSAAVVQLSVPVLAAFGGVVLLSETVTARLVFAGCLILGGIALAIAGRKRVSK